MHDDCMRMQFGNLLDGIIAVAGKDIDGSCLGSHVGQLHLPDVAMDFFIGLGIARLNPWLSVSRLGVHLLQAVNHLTELALYTVTSGPPHGVQCVEPILHFRPEPMAFRGFTPNHGGLQDDSRVIVSSNGICTDGGGGYRIRLEITLKGISTLYRDFPDGGDVFFLCHGYETLLMEMTFALG
jgi:hypothetical protein